MSTKDTTIETVSKDEKPVKKSKTWLWILLGGLLIFFIIIIVIVIIAVFGGFSKSSDTPTEPSDLIEPNVCPSSLSGMLSVYNLNTSGGVEPILVTNGPNYLTNPGSREGSTNNPQIKTKNALGWALLNNSSDLIQVYFYYIDSNNNSDILFTEVSPPPNGLMTWQSTGGTPSNINKPVFMGMTVQIYNLSVSELTTNNYTIPTTETVNINPATDIVYMTYNDDNTMTGTICSL